MTLATYITCFRIILIIPIMYLISMDSFATNLIALILFIFAALTDSLDGYLARKTDTKTSLGALLDLLADKLLVCLVLIWLINSNNYLLFIIPVLIIILREITISSIRQFLYEYKVVRPKVSYIGKSKTTIQFIAISLIIIAPSLGPIYVTLSLYALWLAALISLLSLYKYLSDWY